MLRFQNATAKREVVESFSQRRRRSNSARSRSRYTIFINFHDNTQHNNPISVLLPRTVYIRVAYRYNYPIISAVCDMYNELRSPVYLYTLPLACDFSGTFRFRFLTARDITRLYLYNRESAAKLRKYITLISIARD